LFSSITSEAAACVPTSEGWICLSFKGTGTTVPEELPCPEEPISEDPEGGSGFFEASAVVRTVLAVVSCTSSSEISI
jgi:hypothetical protein